MKEISIEDGSVILKVNPKLYPLEVIYSAAYVFLDRAYVLLDGDPKKEVIVKLMPKEKHDLKKLGGEFFNELINYADYNKRAKETKNIREMLLQRALITNDPSVLQEGDGELDKIMGELDDNEDSDYLEDPEGIAIPWEEKYGKKAKKKSKVKKKK
ncbi:MAG: hypothetical protein UR15_C0033G0005 [Parcubacteria group bacterium GW2011_GWA2_31_28]|nr:MAG: hypothetical protein UR15_C0033G0005 [Parcubacteria group bacterium GW2011_GWA2_31_28]